MRQQFPVCHAVREVDKVGNVRGHPLRHLDGLLDVEVAGMRPAEPQSVEYQRFHPAQGSYGGSVATYVGAGASGKLVHEAAMAIGTVSGVLRPVPKPEDFVLHDC